MIRKKRAVITLLAVLLILCVTAGVTFAYLGGVTKAQQNMFTPADNIRARLIEPNWNEKEGLKLVPGKTIPKDPMITNTGQTDEYVAIRLTFLDKDDVPLPDSKLLQLLNLLDMAWSDKWHLCDTDTLVVNGSGEITAVSQPLVFYYEDILLPGKVTDAIFSSIRVHDESDGLTETQWRWLQGIVIEDGEIVSDPDGIGGLSIKVEGAAVQSVGFADAVSAADTLQTLFP